MESDGGSGPCFGQTALAKKHAVLTAQLRLTDK